MIALDEHCWIDVEPGWVEEESDLLTELIETAPWEQETITLFGRRVQQPRLTAWFGLGMDSSTRYRTTKPAAGWPASLAAMRGMLRVRTGVEFNSALANLYRDGADSVAWHADDEPALGPDPVIASISLGEPRRFLLRRRDKTRAHEVALGRGDLLVMGGATQRLWLHSVPRARSVVAPRVNLTLRRYEVGE